MNETPAAQGGPDSQTGLGSELRALRRSSSQRVVAGVLGGLGQRIGIDPVVLRIATAVLALFGGVGILLYAAAWLIVPADDAPGSLLDQALGRTDERESSAGPMALFLAAVVVVTFGIVVSGSWISFPLLALAAVGLVMLYRRKDDERTTTRDQPLPPTETDQDADYPLSWPDQAGWPEGPDWETAYDSPPPAVVEEPSPAKNQRSPLGWITVCVAMVAVGVLAINDAAWASFPTSTYVAVPLAIVGMGLLIGAWFGRSRALIVLGILLTVVLIPWTFVDDRWGDGEVGTIDRTITRPDQLPLGQPVKLGGGDVTYDLSKLNVRDGKTAELTIDQGFGELIVYVPSDANVEVEAHIEAGDMTVLGESVDGMDRSIAQNQHGDGGTIELDLQLDFGELTVEAR